MERRRRALGLKKQTSESERFTNKEGTPIKSKHHGHIVSKKTEDKMVREGDREALSETLIKQQITPKRPLHGVTQSPVSPGLKSMFPSVLGSPEIEVSWDWGCSQVPKDMLPPRLMKQKSQSKPPPTVSPLTQGPRVVQTRQMSEEENQARLAFYKNVLSQASKCTDQENSKDDIFGDLDKKISSNSTTPKRAIQSPMGNKDHLSAMFDDSANEFMLECSQAVEEQLKNGEINGSAIVNIEIPNQKHALTPDVEVENMHKRVCHGKSKLNLFPDSLMNMKDEVKNGVDKCQLSFKSPKSEFLKDNSHPTSKPLLVSSGSNCNKFDKVTSIQNNQAISTNSSTKTEHFLNGKKLVDKEVTVNRNSVKPQLSKQSKPEILNRVATNSNSSGMEKKDTTIKQSTTLNNNSINYKTTVQANRAHGNVNSVNYDSVDKFRKKPKNLCNSNLNPTVHRVNNMCNTVINNRPIHRTTNPVQVNTSVSDKEVQRRLTSDIQETKQKVDDLTSLLDDGFDMELSSLDFDSLCCNSQEPKKEPVVPKVCTQDEIEAKRKAALSRLQAMMRRRR